MIGFEINTDIITILACQGIGFPVNFKSLIIAPGNLSAHKKAFVQIVPDIMNSQFRIHDHKAPDFISFFEQLKHITQQRVQILNLPLKKNISSLKFG